MHKERGTSGGSKPVCIGDLCMGLISRLHRIRDDIIGFTDLDWAGDANSRRSVSGYTFIFCGVAIAWSAKKQPTIALLSTEAVTTGSPGDRIGPEAGRLRLSHWAGPSVTGSAKVSQSFYGGIIIVILTKGKPVPLAWEFIYKLGEVTRVTSTIGTLTAQKKCHEKTKRMDLKE